MIPLPLAPSRPPGAPPAFHLLAKPSGSACNLDCAYCFFLDKEVLYPGSKFRMNDSLLEQYIRQTIEAHQEQVVNIAWQGGEPTLMGLDFFRRALALAEKYRRPGMSFLHTMQTNGTLLDDDWARFLKEHGFLVGLSIDGPREIHDHYRITKRGTPTFDSVYAAAQTLRKFGVKFNTLTCVNRFNASRPLDVYRFLRRELGSTYLQFIPIVEIKSFEATAPHAWDPARLPLVGSPEMRPDHPDSVVTPWSVDPDEYGYFLSRVWDEWLARDCGKVLVNFCERPLRLSGVPARQHPRTLARRHGVFADAGEIRLREVREAARVLQAVRVPDRLLGRVPEEPSAAHAGRRTGSQLSLPGP